MKRLHNNSYSAHQDVALLLPWYVNNTLQGDEIKLVENHLKVCLTCRRELVALQKLAAAVQQEGSMDSAEQASFAQLKKRIHYTYETSQEKAPIAFVLPDQRKGHGKRWLLPKPALALAAVLLIGFMLPRFIDSGKTQNNEYRTLSNTENPAVSKNTIRVIFSKDTKQPQIDEILASVHGRIIAGPDAQGLYSLAMENKLAAKDVLGAISSLRKSAHVIFAEPAYELLSSTQTSKDTK